MKRIICFALFLLFTFFGSVNYSYAYTRIPNGVIYDGQNVQFSDTAINNQCVFESITPLAETIIDVNPCKNYIPNYIWKARQGTYNFSYWNGSAWVNDYFEVKPPNIATVDVQELSGDTALYLEQYTYMEFFFLSILACLLLFQIFVKFFTRK